MKVLITGISGFVGSNFTQKWKDKFTLYGLDINQNPREGVERIYSWDELGEVPQVDAIIHLAGKAHDTKNQSLADSYFQINTELTKKIFDYFLQSEANTFIFFSSVKAAVDVVEGDMLTEDVIPKPIGPYGESKIAAENYILSQYPLTQEPETRNSKLETKKVFILRPCMIYGPENKGNLNLLYNLVKKGIPWFLGAFENLRSFCSIENISFVVEHLIVKQNVPSGIYNVCDDEPISTNEIIGIICVAVEKKNRIWNLPKEFINTFAKVGTILHLPLNKTTLKKLTESYVVSNNKIKRALGIKKMPTATDTALFNTFKSFQKKDDTIF